ncbi:response regulator transcription factor [Clostridium sp. CM028]|uniref:response regulator transcription factor n=1 Tax=unclassified Clostridium TaxID=2614128 RepID=UPI001C0B5F4D|nr:MULTISPECIES: response regulator transcription factor [unclassified Clostridium]MBU3092531.1 response regulator transcription factor [Clostridium sp. CF011]MBW9146352.1 response regulator transcription factor [Clostridium sp. CM027]MBW9150047.1 response regulator transcription factor [Clostridium sp. CM028]UVE39864.1 response regulator transcription factor [Clostridium sp. CM027]WAG68780.1 response regulator transcription factor [Clostridium sp. CF011]
MDVIKGLILIVDDESRIRRMLKDFLVSHKYEILEASNGKEAMEMFYSNNSKIDLILLDVMMPMKNGFDVLSEIREDSITPIIMLTAKGEEYDQLAGFKFGADDYISKPFSPSLLLARLEAVLKRTGKRKVENVVIGNISVDKLKKEVVCANEKLDLTPKEYDLLLYFIENNELVLAREQILDAVWNYDYVGDARTVDTHIKQLRAKLVFNCQYIKTVHGVGYRFEVKNE